MTSGDTAQRDRPVVALLAVGWLAIGLMGVADGRWWFGAAAIVLGLLTGASFLWPTSPVGRFLSAPVIRRKRPADR